MSTNSTTRTTDSTTGTTQGSAVTQGRANDLWNLGFGNATAANPGYQGQLTAGLTPDQQAAFSLIRNSTGAGQPQLNTATNFATAAGGYTPDQVQAGQAQVAQAGNLGGVDINALTAMLNSATGGTAAAGPAASARDVSTQDLTSKDLTGYMNPYQQNVIDSTLKAINQTQGQTMAQQAGVQARGGAFGDSRSGVESALTAQLFDQNKTGAVAGLNQQNFANAQAQAQTDLARQLDAAKANQGADVSTGVANLNAGTQANIASANNRSTGLVQASLQNASGAQQNNQFNVAQANQASQFNTDLAARIATANQAAGLTGNAQRLDAAGTVGNLGMNVQTQGLNAANALGAAGGVAQGTDQAGLTAQYQNYLQQQGFSQQQIQNLLSIFQQTAPASGMQTQSTTAGTQTRPGSLIPSLLGAASFIPGIGTAASGALGFLGGAQH